MSLIDLLNWRYATKKMNNEKVSDDKIQRILEATRLAPTSSGLQPFEVLVVTNQVIKDKIKAVAWNQTVVSECSHLLVFAAWDKYTEERINWFFDYTNKVRGFENEGFEAYRQKLLAAYPNQEDEVSFQHAARQAYIGFAMAIAQCAEEKVDATPMEGFDPNAVDEILNLRALGLRSAIMLPIGHRDFSNDWLVNLEKVRRPMEKFIREVK